MRPAFLFADEYQHFITSTDREFQSTARSSRICTIAMSQHLPAYYAQIGGSDPRSVVDGLLGNLRTQILCANGDQTTNRWAEETIARGWTTSISTSSSDHRGNGAGGAGGFAGGGGAADRHLVIPGAGAQGARRDLHHAPHRRAAQRLHGRRGRVPRRASVGALGRAPPPCHLRSGVRVTSDDNFNIMGALREGQANADSIARIGKDISGIAGGLIKLAAALTLSTSFGVDMLLRHSFGTRYMSVRAWFLGVLGFMVFAAFFVPDEQGRSIEIIGSAILLAGPAHLAHWIVRVRKFRLHSGFPGVSWAPWHRVSRRVGYWLQLCFLDPLLACVVGWIITAMGYNIGWYLIAGGVVSSLRHTYYALGDRQRQIDQRDALIEAGVQVDRPLGQERILEPSLVTGCSSDWRTKC